MLLSMLGGSSLSQILVTLLLVMPTVLLALTFHEYAHAWVARRLGDPTAENLGRLTLNPLKHLDPVGALLMLFVGIGYAKPVPINSRYFKNPKRDMALTALAGPVMNLLLSFIGVSVYCIIIRFAPQNSLVVYTVSLFFEYFAYLNAYLAAFNLLPVPPFDGSRIAFVLLPDRYYWGIMKYERYILFAVLIILSGLSRIGYNPFGALANGFISLIEKLYTLILF